MTEKEVETALQRLEEVEGAVASVRTEDWSKLGLGRNSNLRQVMKESDAELLDLQEAFIDEHCEQAENLCVLYNEVSECEKKLKAFEEQIFAFQETLTDSAEDILKMEAQTKELGRRVDNRQKVSRRIRDVYDALNECESFCEMLATKDVDGDYLSKIKELEKKIAFLANNKELARSAVDQEIRPKLQAAAQRAGDKLYRYLHKKIQALSEESTNVAMKQQVLEKNGQYAYSFLDRYNKPVATELLTSYVKLMSEVYGKQFRQVNREIAELPQPSDESMLGDEMLYNIKTNRDAAAPVGNQQSAVPFSPSSGAAASAARRQSIFDRKFVKREKATLQAATFADVVVALRAVDLSHNIVSVDPEHASRMYHSTCWTWRFAQSFAVFINAIINESNFVSNFFCGHEKDLEAEERLVRVVLSKAMPTSESAIGEQVQKVEDKVMALSGLRLIELVKNFLCRFINPLPLVILSSVFEVATNALRATLAQGLEKDLKLLQDAAAAKLTPFQPFRNDVPLYQLIADNQSIAACFQPHDATKSFSVVTGKLHLLNTLTLHGSRVDDETGIATYDEVTASILLKQLRAYCQFILNVARRIPVPIGQKIFVVTNLHYVLFKWRKFASIYVPEAPVSQRANSDTTSPNDSISSNASTQNSGVSVAPALDCGELQAHLKNFICQFVHDDCQGTPLAEVLDFIREAESLLGATFFAEEAKVSTEPPPKLLEESATLTLLTKFSRTWTDQLRLIATSVSGCFTAVEVPRLRSVTPQLAAVNEEDDTAAAAGELASLVMKEYCQVLLDCNVKLGTIVNTYYPCNGAILAKVVATQAVLHEVRKMLQSGGAA